MQPVPIKNKATATFSQRVVTQYLQSLRRRKTKCFHLPILSFSIWQTYFVMMYRKHWNIGATRRQSQRAADVCLEGTPLTVPLTDPLCQGPETHLVHFMHFTRSFLPCTCSQGGSEAAAHGVKRCPLCPSTGTSGANTCADCNASHKHTARNIAKDFLLGFG